MDLTFNLDENILFNVRVALFIKHNDEVMLCENKKKDYYSLPGGRVNVGEDTKTAIIREIKEELNYDIRKEELKLVRIVENFFTDNNDRKVHEYLFVYEYILQDEFYNGDFNNLEENDVIQNWVRIEAFMVMNTKPDLIKSIIADSEFKHVILKEKTND